MCAFVTRSRSGKGAAVKAEQNARSAAKEQSLAFFRAPAVAMFSMALDARLQRMGGTCLGRLWMLMGTGVPCLSILWVLVAGGP